jgi:phospholipid/cholesterol/gamma-HCH transport system ATP-binding protein
MVSQGRQAPLVEFCHVTKAFGRKVILEDLNLKIFDGETLCILGGSGSGKSLTLKLMLRLDEVTEGKILYQGEDIRNFSEEELIAMRFKMSMVFQGSALFDSMSVYENIAYPLREHFRNPESQIADIVLRKLALVGLEGVQDQYPGSLSGGQKKRIGLARAIAVDPEMILYDEPTAGLDPPNTKRIDALIMDLQNKLHVTSVVVTHHLESAFLIADRIAFLDERKIAVVGSISEIRHSSYGPLQDFISGRLPHTA